MTTTPFTPGPWSFRFYALDDEEVAQANKLGIQTPRLLTNEGQAAIMSAAGDRIALVDCQTRYKRGEGHRAVCETRDATATAIAALPDLYAACVDVLGFAEAELADRQAENNPHPRHVAYVAEAQAAVDALRAAIARAEGRTP